MSHLYIEEDKNKGDSFGDPWFCETQNIRVIEPGASGRALSVFRFPLTLYCKT